MQNSLKKSTSTLGGNRDSCSWTSPHIDYVSPSFIYFMSLLRDVDLICFPVTFLTEKPTLGQRMGKKGGLYDLQLIPYMFILPLRYTHHHHIYPRHKCLSQYFAVDAKFDNFHMMIFFKQISNAYERMFIWNWICQPIPVTVEPKQLNFILLVQVSELGYSYHTCIVLIQG